jgi:hypothetical protein
MLLKQLMRVVMEQSKGSKRKTKIKSTSKTSCMRCNAEHPSRYSKAESSYRQSNSNARKLSQTNRVCKTSRAAKSISTSLNATSQAKATIYKVLRQVFNVEGVSEQGMSASVREQIGKNGGAMLKVIELLCNSTTPDQEVAELTLEDYLVSLGNVSFSPAKIQTGQDATSYITQLAATHAVIVKLFKRYQCWCENTNNLAFNALRNHSLNTYSSLLRQSCE